MIRKTEPAAFIAADLAIGRGVGVAPSNLAIGIGAGLSTRRARKSVRGTETEKRWRLRCFY